MGSISDSLEIDLLDHVFNGAYTPPATVYLCLCTADPTDAATGASMNEVPNAFSYARTAITFAVAASRVVDQNAAVDFPQASGGAWGTATHWAIASTGTYGSGDVLASGAFGEGKTINDGNTPSVASGEIDVTFAAGEISNVLANYLLDRAFRNQAYAAPDTYVGLCTATIADDDTGSTVTEPGVGSYARKQVNPSTGGAPKWVLAAAGLVDNADLIEMVTATASWGSCVSIGIFSALTAGDLLFYDNDMADQTVGDGDTAKWPIGDLDITMS
jgi:hypothetical protein